jgi:hypothetical protein
MIDDNSLHGRCQGWEMVGTHKYTCTIHLAACVTVQTLRLAKPPLPGSSAILLLPHSSQPLYPDLLVNTQSPSVDGQDGRERA